jgi:hypothetical protein
VLQGDITKHNHKIVCFSSIRKRTSAMVVPSTRQQNAHIVDGTAVAPEPGVAAERFR